MDPNGHPTVAIELARYRIEEEVARAEQHRAAQEARAARKAARRAAQEAVRDTRAVAHSRGISILTVLRGSAGRT